MAHDSYLANQSSRIALLIIIYNFKRFYDSPIPLEYHDIRAIYTKNNRARLSKHVNSVLHKRHIKTRLS